MPGLDPAYVTERSGDSSRSEAAGWQPVVLHGDGEPVVASTRVHGRSMPWRWHPALNLIWAMNPKGPRPVSQIITESADRTIFKASGFEKFFNEEATGWLELDGALMIREWAVTG